MKTNVTHNNTDKTAVCLFCTLNKPTDRYTPLSEA